MTWVKLAPDKWGPRWRWQCASCKGTTFRVYCEKERAKKHRGQRADRTVALCANPKCTTSQNNSVKRVGWTNRRKIAGTGSK